MTTINLTHPNDDLAWSVSLVAIVNAVPKFRTKQEAVAAARKFGWKTAIKIIRRFETAWIVGAFDFQPDEVAGITFEVLRVPMLRYEVRADGIKEQPVLVTRRARL